MDLQMRGMVRFYRSLNNNPEALIRVLSMYVAGEERSEISPLLTLSRELPDCPLRAMVRRQLQDEGRHARLYRQRIKELGGSVYPIPPELQLQEYHFQASGDTLKEVLNMEGREATSPERIAEILLFISVIEEFLLPRLLAHAEACRHEDPRTYFLLMDIVADEMRHVTYTQEQVYEIAGPSRLEKISAMHRQLRRDQQMQGARVFQVMIEKLLPRELLKISRLEHLAWRAVAAQQVRTGAAIPEVMPLPCPEQLVRRAHPYGVAVRRDDEVPAVLRPAIA